MVEVAIVLTIIGLMTAIALPRYSEASNHFKADLAATRILADLTLARSQAVATSSNQTVVFDLASSRYTMAGITGLDGKSPDYILNLSADPYNCSLVSVSFGGATSVTFDAYGSADHGGQITVQSNGSMATVTLEASTGKASVP